ncbi:RNA-guided endonuclease IscB [Nostoc sp.]
MSNFVFVLDTDKQPIDPIQPGQARRLMRLGKAAIYRRYPFTIILKYSVSNTAKQPYQLKIDPGSKTTGLAIVQNNKVIWGAELGHRGQKIRNDLLSRRGIRRARRSRNTRYRQSRFLNRVRPSGWLPPSLNSRVENILTWTNTLLRLVPITGISQELVKI